MGRRYLFAELPEMSTRMAQKLPDGALSPAARSAAGPFTRGCIRLKARSASEPTTAVSRSSRIGELWPPSVGRRPARRKAAR